ncbi:MAG: TrpB-like pyridoxal phosphate-dependent enzyme [Nanoarchaeota archaeon]|nr:TrpB-like pyridoxal phosphate-dependent enzyme [Nanoarchaeota archaeon]
MKGLSVPGKVPKHYYNITADLPFKVSPPINPATKKPINPEELKQIFPKESMELEISKERFIPIPEKILEFYKKYRPTPLIRAKNLEKKIGTNCRIYYKYEGASPTGSHKLNTALAQAFSAKKEGLKGLITETGAGQWGSALSLACKLFDLDCKVFMVRSSYYQKPGRKTIMNIYGGHVLPSPNEETSFGKKLLDQNPEHPGSLGIAISEALETCMKLENYKYSLGSVLTHVLIHQSIIGLEAKEQLPEKADAVIGCVGGGSNFGGIALPFYNTGAELIGVEPESCASMGKGEFKYDFGDTAKITPMLKMHSLGCEFVPPAIHAGGLRYHGVAPLLSAIKEHGLMKTEYYNQKSVFEAGKLFAETEGIIPAPESCHAIKSVIENAKRRKNQVLVFCLSGHGLLDLTGYEQFLRGELE